MTGTETIRRRGVGPRTGPEGSPGRSSQFSRPSAGRRLRPARSDSWTRALGWPALAFTMALYGVLLCVGFTSGAGVLTAAAALVVLVPWLSRVGAGPGWADPATVAVRSSDRGNPSGRLAFDLAGLLRVSLALKLLATLPRYQARDDAVIYHRVGSLLADEFRSLDFDVETGRSIPGTGSVRYLTGLVEVFTFEDEFATFLVFSLFGFVGVVWFVQAFQTAFPVFGVRRYAYLVLLWPSLLYWPSSIGKEAVMLLALGASARGIAGALSGRRSSFAWLAGGLAAAVMVRPHVGLIVVTAAICALVIKGGRGSGGFIGWFGRVALVGALVFGGSLAADGMERLLDIDGLDPSGVQAALDLAESRSAQGGSSFESARVDGLVDYPLGFVTVLFRPIPLEASTATMLLTALEGVLLVGLLIAGLPRVFASLRSARAEAYTVYCLAYVLVFVYLFSALANFGILARQRTTVLPLVLVLVALPTTQERVRRHRERQVHIGSRDRRSAGRGSLRDQPDSSAQDRDERRQSDRGPELPADLWLEVGR